jgi:hypothetical protein
VKHGITKTPVWFRRNLLLRVLHCPFQLQQWVKIIRMFQNRTQASHFSLFLFSLSIWICFYLFPNRSQILERETINLKKKKKNQQLCVCVCPFWYYRRFCRLRGWSFCTIVRSIMASKIGEWCVFLVLKIGLPNRIESLKCDIY